MNKILQNQLVINIKFLFKRNVYAFFSAFLILASCFEDDQIIAPIPVDLSVGMVNLTDNYKYQVFFDLETNTSVSQNLISDWDLGFECSDTGWHVILNTSKMMLAGDTRNTDFNSISSDEGIDMAFDPSHISVYDSTAIGKWYFFTGDNAVSNLHTFLIDRGTNENGESIGLKKVVFDINEDGAYLIRSANLDGSSENNDVIEKNSNLNFVCYSFDNGVVDIEPDKDAWDLLFTKYTTMLYSGDEPYPYLVTGVLQNQHGVMAMHDTLLSFDNITIEYAENIQLTQQKDAIGYDWKAYNFDNSRYTVDNSKVYIIKNYTGTYFKLRFLDFYNSTGEKGYPAFEFIEL